MNARRAAAISRFPFSGFGLTSLPAAWLIF
jgi:hypothetical protein